MTKQASAAPFTLASDDVAGVISLSIQTNPPIEVDVSLFGITERRKLKDEGYFVFYNQQASPRKELCLLPEQKGGEKQFSLALSELPSHIRRISVTLSSDDCLKKLESIDLRIFGADQELKTSFNIPFNTEEPSAFLAEFSQVAGSWQLRPMGEPFANDLGGCCITSVALRQKMKHRLQQSPLKQRSLSQQHLRLLPQRHPRSSKLSQYPLAV